MAVLNWIVLVAGLLIASAMVGRIVDARPLKTRRWPGGFASGTEQQRRQVIALLPLGVGLALLGGGQLAIAWSRPLAAAFIVAAALTFAVALVFFARGLRASG
jgi:hypothetical protein